MPTDSKSYVGKQPAMPASSWWESVKQYVQQRDEDEDADAWAAERRRAHVRNCVCLALCVFTGIAVSLCLGVAIVGITAPGAAKQTEYLLQKVKQSSHVEFAVEFKSSLEEQDAQKQQQQKRSSRRKKQEEAAAFVQKVTGDLIPKLSEDTGRLRFDGVIHVETNTSEVHEIVLADHRGYRTVRASPSGRIVNEGCLRSTDEDMLLPPLHAVEDVPRSAFRVQEFASFHVNCSMGNPFQILFTGIPFVFCPDEEMVPLGSRQAHDSVTPWNGEAASEPSAVALHGKRVVVHANVVKRVTSRKTGAEAARWNEEEPTKTITAAVNVTLSSMASCPYLEAPFSTTGLPRQSFLYHLLPTPEL